MSEKSLVTVHMAIVKDNAGIFGVPAQEVKVYIADSVSSLRRTIFEQHVLPRWGAFEDSWLVSATNIGPALKCIPSIALIMGLRKQIREEQSRWITEASFTLRDLEAIDYQLSDFDVKVICDMYFQYKPIVMDDLEIWVMYPDPASMLVGNDNIVPWYD